MADEKPVQHTPKHLEGEVFDPRHPAASPFAVAQPAAGVVADDVEEKGQNLAGGPTAQAASGTYSDQKEVLAKQHADDLRQHAGVTAEPQAVEVKGDKAKPAPSSRATAVSQAKPE